MEIYTPMVVSSRSESSSVRSTLQRYDGRSLSRSVLLNHPRQALRQNIVRARITSWRTSVSQLIQKSILAHSEDTDSDDSNMCSDFDNLKLLLNSINFKLRYRKL
ncbi:hypothetical protein P8452_41319 [Trifolium repens]|nr:hypothetical protein P8452_41319 [Trifolium repens]